MNDLLICGSYPFDKNIDLGIPILESLISLEINDIIDLTVEFESNSKGEALISYKPFLGSLRNSDSIRYHRVSINDNRSDWDLEQFFKAKNIALTNITNKRRTFIHCRGGLYRTSLLVSLILYELGFKTNELIFSELKRAFKEYKYSIPVGYKSIVKEIEPHLTKAMTIMATNRDHYA